MNNEEPIHSHLLSLGKKWMILRIVCGESFSTCKFNKFLISTKEVDPH
jgi:hypothetical protein